MPDILVPIRVLWKLLTMTDALLDYWVTGNTLSDPAGNQLIESLSVLIERTTYVFAWFWSIA